MYIFNKKPVALAIACALGGLVAGCNSSSSSSPTLTGTFVDSAVDGLDYKGPRFSGKTANGGHYNFREGDLVEFFLGDNIKLGTLKGSTENVSPRDFFEGIDSDVRLLNILILLQSLDSDGNTSNGITITAEAITALEDAIQAAYPDINLSEINLSLMDLTEANDLKDKIADILQDVVDATESPDDKVVSEEEAEIHFTEVMSGDITIHKNISRTPAAGSGGHSIASLTTVIDATNTLGDTDTERQVHPLLISYTDIVQGDFQLGTGSSEIPDIDHVADVFVALSQDDGETWKAINISRTGDKSSIDVNFWGQGELEPYFGTSFKPVIKTQGNNILVAWNDKYCPSGNPQGFENVGTEEDPEYAEDLYLVNGPQGTINYEGSEYFGEELVPAYEVPFSCIWTARGVYDEDEKEVVWHAPMQLTTGRRDTNKIGIASSAEGFVMTWQEDPVGLRPGGGSGPGDGWSGASTNHKSDIWYSYIPMGTEEEPYFSATDGSVTEDDTTKPKSAFNLSYPVPVTDNAVCLESNVIAGTGAKYCEALCTDNGIYVDNPESDYDDRDAGKCYSNYNDPLHQLFVDSSAYPETTESAKQLLNGDTGASRPLIGLYGNQVILAYEETKGAAETIPGLPNSETLDAVDVEDQGKVGYVHSFAMTNPDVIAPGTVVNHLEPKAPEVDGGEAGDPVLENVRRLTLISQVDTADVTDTATQHLWGILYKSGIETQGESSDMNLRLAKGSYDVSALNDFSWNVSSHTPAAEETEKGTWDQTNLDDATWENSTENTFSPRGFLRGDKVVVGYEYTPSWRVAQVGHLSNNFHVTYSNDNGETWAVPQDITAINNNVISTVDPRLIPAAKTVPNSPLAEDVANPDVIFVSYGTLEMGSGEELDLFVTRSTDGGATWEKVPSNPDAAVPTGDINEAIVSSVAEEKEVQGMANAAGTKLYSLWLQELDPHEAPESAPDYLLGSDVWAQRKDYDAETPVEPGTLLFENFENGIPSTWQVYDGLDDGVTWIWLDGSSYNIETPFNNDSFNNYSAAIYGTLQAGQTLMEELYSPIFDASDIDSSIYLEFANYFQSGGYSNELADVYIGVDGTSWTRVLSMSGADYGPELHTIDITNIASGHSNVRLRFVVQNAPDYSGYEWFIDNVKVYAQP